MPLSAYQLGVLKDFRIKENNLGLKFISIGTASGYFSQYDAYKKITHTETYTFFSGAVLLDPAARKSDVEGGFYNLSDIIIVASRDHKVMAQAKDTKIQYEGINFRASKITDVPDTNEIVIFANRLE